MAQNLEYAPDDVSINGIIQRYFDIYLPANLDDQMEEKGDNPFLPINGQMDIVSQNDISNAREVVSMMEGYFKDILNPKYYEYFIADGTGTKKYIFQKNGSIVGTKVIAGSANNSNVEQKYSFESDNQIMSFADVVSESGPTYAQAQAIEYDRQASYYPRMITQRTLNSEGQKIGDTSSFMRMGGDEISKYYMEIPLLIMRNSVPMTSADLERLKQYSQRAAGGKLELEISVSPYTVLYIDEVPGSEQPIRQPRDNQDYEAMAASQFGRYQTRKDFSIRVADGLVSDILSTKRDSDISTQDLLEAVKDIFSEGEDVRLFGSSNSYEVPAVIEKIFIEAGEVRVRVKSKHSTNAFRIEAISGVSSKILAMASSSTRVGITPPGKAGKSGRVADDKASRNSKGSAIKTINIYAATENRSDAMNPFDRQFLGPKLDDVAKLVNAEKAKKEVERKAAAERNRKAYKYKDSQYYAPPIDYQDILIEGFNSLANAFTGEENAAINRTFNNLVAPQLKSDRDRLFEFTSSAIAPKESLKASLEDLYTFDATTIRFFKALDMAVIKVNILYNPFSSSILNERAAFKTSNSSLNVFDLAGVKIGLKIAK